MTALSIFFSIVCALLTKQWHTHKHTHNIERIIYVFFSFVETRWRTGCSPLVDAYYSYKNPVGFARTFSSLSQSAAVRYFNHNILPQWGESQNNMNCGKKTPVWGGGKSFLHFIYLKFLIKWARSDVLSFRGFGLRQMRVCTREQITVSSISVHTHMTDTMSLSSRSQ